MTLDLTRVRAAIELAARAHRDGLDLSGEELYIMHPLRVMARVETMAGESSYLRANLEDAMVAAVLHDTVEDTSVTLDTIEAKFGPEVATMVDALSRRAGETYRDFLARTRAHPIARFIKIADINDNLSRPLIPGIGTLRKRYTKALAFLEGA